MPPPRSDGSAAWRSCGRASATTRPGARVRAFLEADGVDTRYVRTLPAGRTSTSAVIVDAKGERLIVGERDHAMSLDPSWLPFESNCGRRRGALRLEMGRGDAACLRACAARRCADRRGRRHRRSRSLARYCSRSPTTPSFRLRLSRTHFRTAASRRSSGACSRWGPVTRASPEAAWAMCGAIGRDSRAANRRSRWMPSTRRGQAMPSTAPSPGRSSTVGTRRNAPASPRRLRP